MIAFIPLNIAVLTVSDTRDFAEDKSGAYLEKALINSGHQLADRKICRDDIYQIRAIVSQWIANDLIHAILTTGGTGVTGRDITPEALSPLFDKTVAGFGELFRFLSYEEIGTSTVQSRALAGLSNKTYLFALPGSSGACKTAWTKILQAQLDNRHRPCNFSELITRLGE
ncbi:MAG: molybdenum cofactor biosynthesis protein B [Ostreibacterium sp.]